MRGADRVPTKDEHEALLGYSGKTYRDLNYRLRVGLPLTAEQEMMRELLDTAIGHAKPLAEGMIFHRGMDVSREVAVRIFGSRIDQYTSTTNTGAANSKFGQTVIEMVLPKGSRLLDMNGKHMPGDIEHTLRWFEGEWLMGRKAMFKVLNPKAESGPIRVKFLGYLQ